MKWKKLTNIFNFFCIVDECKWAERVHPILHPRKQMKLTAIRNKPTSLFLSEVWIGTNEYLDVVPNTFMSFARIKMS